MVDNNLQRIILRDKPNGTHVIMLAEVDLGLLHKYIPEDKFDEHYPIRCLAALQKLILDKIYFAVQKGDYRGFQHLLNIYSRYHFLAGRGVAWLPIRENKGRFLGFSNEVILEVLNEEDTFL